MNQRDKALELVKANGPLIPSQIAKELGTNILLASAILSELVSSNLIKLSNLKIGGSPLYYAPGQEEKLQIYSDKLNEKEKRAYELLKERKILKDSELDALTRFCLRQVKDFAKPLEVITDKSKELYWGWYMLAKEEAESLIEKELSKLTKEEILKAPEVAKKIPVEVPVEAVKEKIAPIETKPIEEKKARKERQRVKVKKDNFMDKVLDYFKKKNIEVMNSAVLKKNSEIDFLIKVSSAIGKTEYYCKAKNKKKATDADISTAFAQGQLKKLPVVFLTPGELSKKGKELIEKLENVNFEKLN